MLYSPAALAVKVKSAVWIATEQLFDLTDAVFLLTKARKKGPTAYTGLAERAARTMMNHKAEFLGIIALEV